MKGTSTLLRRPATPEEVLAILQDWQRLEWGKALDAAQVLTFDTTVKEWRDDCDLAGWQQLGTALSAFFGAKIAKDEWRAVMKPENQKTLRNLCALVASRSTLPEAGEVKILGQLCRPAATFYALRSHLIQAGVEVLGIRPSTRLDNFLRLHTEAMVEAITKLAPGRLPVMTTKFNLGHKIGGWTCLLGLVALVLGWVLEFPELTVIGCLVFAAAFISTTFFSNQPPAAVHFENLETFADLSRLMVTIGVGKEAAIR